MHPITDKQFKNLCTLKIKKNAYKSFHIFACMSVIKTCITDLVLKDKNAQHQKPFSYSLQIALMSL